MQTICSLFVLGGTIEGGGRPTPPYPFWSVWLHFSTWERLFLVGLGALSVYVLFSVAATGLRVRRIRALLHNGQSTDTETFVCWLRERSITLNKLLGAAFCLFGMVLFYSLQLAYIVISNSNVPIGWIILRDFEPHFAFAFNVFFIFLLLHLSVWFMSSLADRYATESGTCKMAQSRNYSD